MGEGVGLQGQWFRSAFRKQRCAGGLNLLLETLRFSKFSRGRTPKPPATQSDNACIRCCDCVREGGLRHGPRVGDSRSAGRPCVVHTHGEGGPRSRRPCVPPLSPLRRPYLGKNKIIAPPAPISKSQSEGKQMYFYFWPDNTLY